MPRTLPRRPGCVVGVVIAHSHRSLPPHPHTTVRDGTVDQPHMEEAEMADTTTTSNNDTQASSSATNTSQGMFVAPTTQTGQQAGQQAGQDAAQNDQQDPQAPKPGPPPAKATTAHQDPKPNEGDKTKEGSDDEQGKGSKSAVLADLARERDARQETEQRLNSVLEALGINKGTDPDPEQVKADLTAQRAENAVLRAGNGIADTEALLDSRRFTESLTKLDVTNPEAVKAHIEQFVTDNPRYAPDGQQQPTPGVRDAAATATTTSTETDWLRNAIRR